MVNKSDLFKRAWQLVRWNGGKLTFAKALKLAWSEAKTGGAAEWSFEPPPAAQVIRDRIAFLETADRLGRVGIANLAAAYRMAA